jgi:hypothetical protein
MDGLVFTDNQIYIIPEKKDTPVKIAIDTIQDITHKIERIQTSEKLMRTLSQMFHKNEITTQQYKSIKGQIKKGYEQMVVNFFKKRGYFEYYCTIPSTAEIYTIKQNFGVAAIGKDVYAYEK